MKDPYDKTGTWECVRLGCQLLLVTLAVVVAAAACAALVGCSGFQGKPEPYAKVGLGSPARHNVEPLAGLGCEWENGGAVEVRYEPWLRVDEPSSRGFPREIGRVFAEAKIPLGR